MLLVQQNILMIQDSLFAFLMIISHPYDVLTILLLSMANIYILMQKQYLFLHLKTGPHYVL